MGCLKLTYREEPTTLRVVKSFSFSEEKSSAGVYSYGFNGMEKDDEVKGSGNSYTTEFRQYDARLGRWLTIDPIIHAYQSPYCAFDNNPIYWADPSGANSDPPKDGDGRTDENGNSQVYLDGKWHAGVSEAAEIVADAKDIGIGTKSLLIQQPNTPMSIDANPDAWKYSNLENRTWDYGENIYDELDFPEKISGMGFVMGLGYYSLSGQLNISIRNSLSGNIGGVEYSQGTPATDSKGVPVIKHNGQSNSYRPNVYINGSVNSGRTTPGNYTFQAYITVYQNGEVFHPESAFTPINYQGAVISNGTTGTGTLGSAHIELPDAGEVIVRVRIYFGYDDGNSILNSQGGSTITPLVIKFKPLIINESGD